MNAAMNGNGHGPVALDALAPFVPDVLAIPAVVEAVAPTVEAPAVGVREVDDQADDHTSMPVDSPAADDDRPVWERPADRRPVVAPWVRDLSQLRRAIAWSVGEALHPVLFHAARGPLYGVRLASGSPRGAVKASSAMIRWAGDGATRDRLAILDAKDSAAYLALSRQRDDRVRRRTRIGGVGLAAVLAGQSALYVAEPGLFTATTVAGVLALGAVGRRRDRPIIDSPTTVSSRAPKLSSDVVERALANCGLPASIATKIATTGLEWVAPIAIDGPGWLAQFDLPYGVTVAEVADKREKLASGLRRPLGAVWPEPESDEHPGRMRLWVGQTTLAKAKAPAWPLLKAGQADIFKPLPFGTDQRLRPVSIPLIFDSVLIGAMPRYGKTMALRVLLLGAALDPHVVLYVYELKGTGDLSSPGEQVAHRYASGANDATLRATMDGLEEVYAELERRADLIRSLPKAVCPENKITPELAHRPGSGLAPILLSIDECQELFSHKEFKDEATRLCVAIIKRGPALGIMLALATQRPTAESLPKDISANMGLRFCLRVAGHVENNMILGTGMSARGVQAYQFGRKDKGIGWLAGLDDDPIVVRSAYVDAPAAERVADRARALRLAAGLLTGQAAGEAVEATDDGPDHRFLGDVLTVMRDDSEHLAVLAVRLADVDQRYQLDGDPWQTQRLGGALRAAGAEVTKQLWATAVDGTPGNATGVTRDTVRAAISRAAEV
ncbi:FtsK/SpoIIIE domain-containing protein [Frankia sp. Cas3]|uniref:FtsK/SpoIIIE domain-containing protein n=1 Tax=Frankia sp. Cas3 TaxID=3073926 RepID=UPI002AD597BC|nr:FtsK/SpoIIIE domain-containing protein [Frankia sp. Cas3]